MSDRCRGRDVRRPALDRPYQGRARRWLTALLLVAGSLSAAGGCKKAEEARPVEPQVPAQDIDAMSAEELVAAHRAAVGPLKPDGKDAHLDTLRITYTQAEGEFVMQRQLVCDARGRARVTYSMSPAVVRGVPEGASYDGQTLWRQTRRGRVLGPMLKDLGRDVPPPVAWAILELGLTPLYCPLADELGFEVRRDTAPSKEPDTYSLLIGPAERPYARVILDRKTHLVRRIERLFGGQVQSTIALEDYWRPPALEVSLPRRIVSQGEAGSSVPPTTWTLALQNSMRLVSQPDEVYAGGKLPEVPTRLAQQSRFMMQAPVSSPPQPRSVRGADLDGDGLLDVAVAGPGSLVAYYNDGSPEDGPFARWDRILVDRVVHQCVVPVDLNADSLPELLVTAGTPSTAAPDAVFVLTNAGHRRFEPPIQRGVADGPEWIAVGLLTDDWVPDLAVVSSRESKVSVFQGRRNPLIPLGIDYGAGAAFEFKLKGIGRRVELGDFNGDNLMDIAATDEGRLVVLMQKAGEKLDFEPTEYGEVGEVPYALVVADFNGDGRDDVAVGNGGDLNGDAVPEVFVLLSDETGKLNPSAVLVAGSNVPALAAADFDGDGDEDLAATCFEDHSVYVWPNNGDGTFGNPDAIWTDYAPRGLAAGDFDGDGRIDLAVIHQYGESLVTLLNRREWHEFVEQVPAGTFAPATQPASPGSG